MARQDFQPFAVAANANVISQSDYLASNWLPVGFSAGIAYSNQANKVLRQASIISTVIAQAITDVLGVDVIDDGTISTIEGNFLALFKSTSRIYAADTGNVNSLVITLPSSQAPPNYGAILGAPVIIKLANTNTGDATLDVNGLGTIPIINPDGSALSAGQLVAGGLANVLYDGVRFELISTTTGPLTLKTNTWTQPQTWARPGVFQSNLTVQGSTTTGGLTSTGAISGAAGAVITGYDANGAHYRTINGNYGAFIRNDGTSLYLLQTASGNQFGTFNSFRPFSWNMTTGAVTIDQTGLGTAFGGPATVGGALTVTGNISGQQITASSGVEVSNADANGFHVRVTAGGYGVGIRNDGSFGYLLQTGINSLTINNIRPFWWNLATGAIGIDGTGAGISTGGALAVGTSLSSGGAASFNGTVNSNGNIVANNGRLRAGLGATNTGDPNCATILADFALNPTGGNGYQILPSGLILAWASPGVAGGNTPQLFNLPIAFPHGTLAIIGNFQAHNPPFNGSAGFDFANNSQFWGNNTAPSGINGCFVLAIGF